MLPANVKIPATNPHGGLFGSISADADGTGGCSIGGGASLCALTMKMSVREREKKGKMKN